MTRWRRIGGLGESAEVFKFIEDMPAAFARADLVVCRSGASTVAEIAAAGKPAVFVPFPRAADDHQRVNAEALARHGAAVVVEESKLEGVWLAETIAALLQDSQRLQQMSHAARELAHPNAARDIAAMAARVAGIEESSHGLTRISRILVLISVLGVWFIREIRAKSVAKKLTLCLPKFSAFIS